MLHPERTASQSYKNIHYYNFHFTGNSWEYFKLWLVNIGLSFITLGVYSAWAKVRTTRYFYGNTWLEGSSFEYRAHPLSILLGRFLALLFFIAYLMASSFYPLEGLLLLLILWLITPWIIMRSLRFRLSMTTFRNVRFHFSGTLGHAYIACAVWPVIGTILFFLYPLARRNWFRYYINHAHYGRHPLHMDATRRRFYIEYFLFFAIVLISIFAFLYLVEHIFSEQWYEATEDSRFYMIFILMAYLLYFFSYTFFKARIRNLVFNHMHLGKDIYFRSHLRVNTLLWLYLTNLLAILFSLGLLYPWTRIRMARYYAECTQIVSCVEFDHFVDIEPQKYGAFGEEMGSLFDLEVGL